MLSGATGNMAMKNTRKPFGLVIATRRLVSHGEKVGRVRVSLGTPRWNNREWECPFRIRGSGVSEMAFGHGVDSMQALTTALDGIRAILDKKFGSVSWEGVLPDDSGFQRQIPITFGGSFSRRLERMVDRECNDYLRQLKRRGAKRRALKHRNVQQRPNAK